MSAYIEANEPDTLAFEWFGDEATGTIVWYQVYTNDGALQHAQTMKEAGFASETQQLLTRDRLLLLTPLTHPQAQEMAKQLGAEELETIARVVR